MDPSHHTQNPPIREEVRAYWQSLGRFVSKFAMVEANMQLALWHYANVSPNIGRAVFSGVRADAAMGLINRIAEVEKWGKAKKGELKKLFDHLGEINKLRNDIIHFGTRFESDGSLHVTNAFMALNEGRLRKIAISDKILDQLTHDLTKITYSLFLQMFDSLASPELLETFRRQAAGPWQYKLPQQSNRARGHQRTPQAQSR